MIQAKNLSFSYNRRQELFKDLMFDQPAGSILGLLGKNGSGKSTLLYLISGLLQPKKGGITVNGHVPFKREPDFLTNSFIVPDELFLPPLSIDDYTNVYAPLYKNFDLKKMEDILSEFKLHKKDRLNKLSHGQQKKFLISFALASRCKILLFDEPTNGLDIPSKSIFRKVLVGSVEEDQMVIISTHQVKDVETIIDRIVILEDGGILFEKDMVKIAEKIQFKRVPRLASSSNVLYHEKCPEGFNVMLPLENNEETEVDIELLFNAITNKTDLNF